MGDPQFSDVGNRWDSIIGVSEERGGKLPTVRHEYLLGFIGRTHCPAQVQVEGREIREGGSIRIAGTLFSCHLQKTDAPLNRCTPSK